LKLIAIFLLFLAIEAPVYPQTKKQSVMLIEGTIRIDGASLLPTSVIRVLRRDSSIAKTVLPYASFPNQFGVRLSTSDGFQKGDPLLFRCVLSSRDSFLCRSFDAPPAFANSLVGEQRDVFNIVLTRNHKPHIVRGLPDTTIREGRTFVYKVFATDMDLDRLYYRLKEAPPNAQIHPTTGIFQWTPSFDDSGSHSVSIEIDDLYDRVETRTTMIKVLNVNRPPTVVQSPPAGIVREGESMFFEVQGFDPDHDSLSYWFTDRSRKFDFPTSTGQIVFSPTFQDSGTYIFSALVTDGSLSDTSEPFRITVLNVNRAPNIISSTLDTTIDENQEIRILFRATDPDGDSTQLALLSAPLGAEFTSDGTFFWKPNFQQAGEYNVSVLATDRSLSREAGVHIVVRNLNHLPPPVSLHFPRQQDTVNLEAVGRFVEFSWSNSNDEDVDDLVQYDLHIVGSSIDTVFRGILDTSVAVEFRNKLQLGKAYSWFVVVNDGHDLAASGEIFTFRLSSPPAITHESPLPVVPKQYSLQQTIPDPTSAIANIRYALPERSRIQLSVFNMVGEKLKQLVAEEKDPGIYVYGFDTSNLSGGVYMVELQAHSLTGSRSKDFVSTKKMVLVR